VTVLNNPTDETEVGRFSMSALVHNENRVTGLTPPT
jgi:hypothetical protein